MQRETEKPRTGCKKTTGETAVATNIEGLTIRNFEIFILCPEDMAPRRTGRASGLWLFGGFPKLPGQ